MRFTRVGFSGQVRPGANKNKKKAANVICWDSNALANELQIKVGLEIGMDSRVDKEIVKINFFYMFLQISNA